MLSRTTPMTENSRALPSQVDPLSSTLSQPQSQGDSKPDLSLKKIDSFKQSLMQFSDKVQPKQ